MDNYKYTSSNKKEPLLEFFTERPLCEWTLENFIQYVNGNKRQSKSRKVLKKNFYNCLKVCIMDDPSVPSEVKHLILKFLKNDKETETKQSIIVNGDVYSSIIGGENNKLHAREPQQPQQPQQQQQQQHEQPDDVEARHSEKNLELDNDRATSTKKRKYTEDNDEKETNQNEINDVGDDEELAKHEISFISITTDSTYSNTNSPTDYGERLNYRRYVLSLDELGDNLFQQPETFLMDINLTLEERLELSSIKYHHACPPDKKLQYMALPDHHYNILREWRRSIKHEQSFNPSPFFSTYSSMEDIDFSIFLYNLHDTIKRSTFNTELRQSEADFTMDIGVLLKYIFPSTQKIIIRYGYPTMARSSNTKILTLDISIYYNDCEIGCGEIKTGDASKIDKEEDLARIAELMKKQLNLRIKNAKHTREFQTFGFFIDRYKMHLFTMIFSNDFGYQHYLLDETYLPISRDTCIYIEEALETLKSFKTLIQSTLAKGEDITAPYIYNDYVQFIKPTIAFVNNDKDDTQK